MNDDPPIIIGERQGWGDQQRFGISAVDQRQHLYIIGKTGSGKTTLLRNLIVQHIALGHGVGLIDPHGDLAEEILHHIPPHRADHLCYFNPGDLEFPVGLNPLANVAPDDRHLVASGIVSAFKGIWRDSWGPRLEYILYNALSALLDCRNATLLGINRMLTDARYRAKVIRQIKDPFIKSFWADEYAGYDERFQREAIAPIQNKLGQFLLNPVIRNILGQVRRKVSIPFVMNNGRLFIANLSKGRIGHDKANLLGSLLTTQFQLAAMARTVEPEHERRDFYLFIDEFQNFTTDAFASILSEARKYRLNLTLSHQYIDQLPLPIREAVFHQKLKGFFAQPEKLAAHLHQSEETLKEKEALIGVHQQTIQKIRDEMKQTHRLYVEGHITPQGFGEFYKPAEEQLNQLMAELPKLQGEVDVMKVNQISGADVLAEADTLYERWPALAIDDRRQIAETLCEKITIGDGKIRITFTGAPSSGELCKSLTRLYPRFSIPSDRSGSRSCFQTPKARGSHLLTRFGNGVAGRRKLTKQHASEVCRFREFLLPSRSKTTTPERESNPTRSPAP